MMQKSLDLSGKISSIIVDILESIKKIVDSLDIPFFVVGAAARDFILYYGFDIEIRRATEDMDLGVMVKDWNRFSQLSEEMVESELFERGKDPQRFYYKGDFPIDIVPFGRISEPDEIISWPECEGVEMNTLGFTESYHNSLLVRIRTDPVFEIRFASLAGLAAMKIIAWKDRYPLRNKDAKDLEYIMRNYIEAGNFERVYGGEESDLTENENPDYELMSARLLGRDVVAMLSPESKEYILKILNGETGEQNRYKFIEDMRKGDSFIQDVFEERLNLLEAFKAGFLERL
jgi:predicted nucleotidyltransferase